MLSWGQTGCLSGELGLEKGDGSKLMQSLDSLATSVTDCHHETKLVVVVISVGAVAVGA